MLCSLQYSLEFQDANVVEGEMTGDKHFEIIISAAKVNCSAFYHEQGRVRNFFRRGAPLRNGNKPHSFFMQNTSCITKPQVTSGVRGGGRGWGLRTPCTLPSRSAPAFHVSFQLRRNSRVKELLVNLFCIL